MRASIQMCTRLFKLWLFIAVLNLAVSAGGWILLLRWQSGSPWALLASGLGALIAAIFAAYWFGKLSAYRQLSERGVEWHITWTS